MFKEAYTVLLLMAIQMQSGIYENHHSDFQSTIISTFTEKRSLWMPVNIINLVQPELSGFYELIPPLSDQSTSF